MTEVLSARRSATRERLIDAALGVFAEQGVGGATVEQICEAAGFTRGAFYSNFESKDALCLAVLQRQADENLSNARAVIANLDPDATASFDELLLGGVGAFLAAQRSDRAWVLTSVEMRLHAVREESLRRPYLQMVAVVSDMFAGLLGEAVASYGMEFSVPSEQVVPVLHAVYEHGAISEMLAGEAVGGGVRATALAAVLRAMLRPVEHG